MQETQVRSLGQEDPWRRKWQSTPVFLPGNPMDRGAWWAIVQGSQRVGHDFATKQQKQYNGKRISLSFKRIRHMYVNV